MLISIDLLIGGNPVGKSKHHVYVLFLVLSLCFQVFYSTPIVALQPTSPVVLNNGMLRFGTGSENSINATGNLQQPFYRTDNGVWRQLTFSSNPLDFEIMEGGDGTLWWNRNGSSALNPILDHQTFDYSRYTQSADGGYGTIITSGTTLINGKLVQITHEYSLPQDKFLIQITTTFKNLSSSSMTNFRYWVGTRDDYVGSSDNVLKTKGNITDGEFVSISQQSEVAKALKITSNNEGVLFYTNSDQANIIIGNSYGWSNIQGRNPIESPISIQNDGSYAFYVRFDDLAPQEEVILNWYYAAGTLANLDSIIQDVYDSVQLSGLITNDSMQFEINESRNATTYYVVVPSSEPVPTSEQIIQGLKADGTAAAFADQIQTLANQPQLITVSGLTPGTRYTLYIVVRYSEEEVVVVNPIVFQTTNRYTYSFDSAGGSSIEAITQDAGTALIVPTPTKSGHTFLGWDPQLPSVMGSEDQHFTAVWQINSYVLTFNARNGTDHVTQNVVYNELAQSITPTRLGYTFGGWYKESSLTNLWDFETDTMPATNVMLYARWIANSDTPYRVEHYVQNIHDDEYTLFETDYLVGTTHAIVLATPLERTGLIENTDLCERIDAGIINPDGSLVLQLYYDRSEYRVVFKDWDNTEIESYMARHGQTLVFPNDVSREGFTFKGWDQEIDVVTSDLTITAVYLFNPIIETNILDPNLEVVIEGLENAIDFSDEERLEEVRLILELSVFDETTLPHDIDLLNAFITNTLMISSSRSLLMDISLFKVVGEVYTQLTSSLNAITISFVVPVEFQEEDFMLVHVHGDEVTLLDFDYDPQTHVVTFVTNKFSTFALVLDTAEQMPPTSDSPSWAWLYSLMGGCLIILSLRKKVKTH